MQAISEESRLRSLAERETYLFRPSKGGGTGVCVVYPNDYRLGMGNLGLHAVYRILHETPDHYAERAFLPEGPGPLLTVESRRPASDFDILAFSISFETDYLNLPVLFDRAGLPRRSADRDDGHPLVIAGGSAVFLNPEPIAEFVDLFLVGEAEEMLPEFLDFLERGRVAGWSRDETLARAPEIRGVYVPRLYTPHYDGGRLARVDGPGLVERRYVADLENAKTQTAILADDVAFGDMMLVEASRGCQWGCRFCAAGFMYRPIRTRDPKALLDEAVSALEHRGTVGLVGAELASIPGVASLAEAVADRGGRTSPASLKADCVSSELARALGRNGARTVTIAPEAGSEKMRRVINKNLREPEILRAANRLVGEGAQDLKLYFMMGLPTETDEDVDEIAGLSLRVRERFMARGKEKGRIGKVSLSVNAFVPKPWTPLQWDPMVPVKTAKAKLERIRRRLRAVPNVEVDGESPREAYLQTFLSRGDRRVSRWIEEIHRNGGAWWPALRSGRGGKREAEGLIDPDAWVHRPFDYEDTLPWDFIDHQLRKIYLWTERNRAFLARETPPCDVSTCKSCGAC